VPPDLGGRGRGGFLEAGSVRRPLAGLVEGQFWYLFGDRVDDKEAPGDPIPAQSESARILREGAPGPRPKCVVATWLGGSFGVAGWCFDPYDFRNMGWAFKKRIAPKPPEFNHHLSDEFRRACYMCPRLWFPERLDTIISFERWLDEKKGYSSQRKLELWRAYRRHGGDPELLMSLPRATWNEIFIKREMYMEWKFPRIISSRSDMFKAYSATFFHRVDQILFQSREFIKLIPVDQRPTYVQKMLGGCGLCATTDFKSWESCIQGLLQYAELQLYKWLGRDLEPRFMKVILEVIGGKQTQRNRNGFKATTFGRQSGDMCTSCGNGYINMLVCSFAAWKCGWIPQFTRIRGCFEGDDGIYAVGRNWQDFRDLLVRCGVRISKMEVDPDPGRLGFLSTYWSRDLVPLTDFRRYLVRLPWALERVDNPRIRTELLRAKGLSLACAAAGCPVLSAYARMILRITEGYQARYHRTNQWWELTVMGNLYGTSHISDELAVRLRQPIPPSRRILYHSLFGISLSGQIALEKALDAHNGMGELDYKLVAPYLDPMYRLRWYNNVGVRVAHPTVARTPGGLNIHRNA